MTSSKTLFYLKGACLLILSAGLVCQGFLFLSRRHYQTGVRHLAFDRYGQAVREFGTALETLPSWVPGLVTRQDKFRIYSDTGKAHYEKGRQIWREKGISRQVFTEYSTAMSFFRLADLIDPDTYINTYRMALTGDILETLSKNKKFDPGTAWNADFLYQKATRLRPYGISIHQTYARYLHRKKEHSAVSDLAGKMVRIFPQIYGNLKQEPYFTENLLPVLESGLEEALAKGIQPRDALRALSDINVRTHEMDKALSLYARSLEIRSYGNPENDYLHMGRLCLKAEKFDDGHSWFEKVLTLSKDPEAAVRQILNVYKAERKTDEFIKFAMKMEADGLDNPLPALDIAIAEAFIDLKQYAVAKSRLLRFTDRTPDAKAYYLLAGIAETEKDWDRMELSSQKATSLDRENSNYHLLLSRSLNAQKKFPGAEEAATLAIRYAKKEQPWLFDHRAWTRWSQKKYNDAAQDWKRAFSLKPEQASFAFNIARAYEQAGNFPEAMVHIKKALKLDPNKPEYRQLESVLSRIEPVK